MKLKKTTRKYQITLDKEEYMRILEITLLSTKYFHNRAISDACDCADKLYKFIYGKEDESNDLL